MPLPVVIRPLRTHAEREACVALQETTWGAGFAERVPASLLAVVPRIGGIAAGAFAPDARLVGCVFGITGVEDGRLVHWSDILAVAPDARDAGIGRRLKEYQRDTVRRLGVHRIYWTYDPLVARNAHLNLVRLGARVTEYVPDMYGAEPVSALHLGIGTDRFIVAWEIDPDASRAPVIDPRAESGTPVVGLGGGAIPAGAPRFRLEIPADIHTVQGASLAEAAAWRAATRRALGDALAAGFAVAGFYRDPAGDRCFYVLERGAPPGAAATGGRA